MVKHIVLWRLHDEANGNTKAENAQLIKEKLESMQGKIPGMLKVEVGINFNETDLASDVVLYSEFESKEALDAYQVHPEHVKFKEFVSSYRFERRVVDYIF